jgi:hypothetical protein
VSATPIMTPEVPPTPEPVDSQLAAEQLPNHKVRVKKLHQRACNLKDAKAKICGGHLKRWFYVTDSVEAQCGDALKAWGPDREVYRCEHCKTLYLPNPDENKKNVAGVGMTSIFGLTIPPKEEKK